MFEAHDRPAPAELKQMLEWGEDMAANALEVRTAT
jgi:hypothetical protein